LELDGGLVVKTAADDGVEGAVAVSHRDVRDQTISVDILGDRHSSAVDAERVDDYHWCVIVVVCDINNDRRVCRESSARRRVI